MREFFAGIMVGVILGVMVSVIFFKCWELYK